jgi:hypothetical protein
MNAWTHKLVQYADQAQTTKQPSRGPTGPCKKNSDSKLKQWDWEKQPLNFDAAIR